MKIEKESADMECGSMAGICGNADPAQAGTPVMCVPACNVQSSLLHATRDGSITPRTPGRCVDQHRDGQIIQMFVYVARFSKIMVQ